MGDLVEFGRSPDLISYHHICPEVPLFENYRGPSFIPEIASSDGEWDNYRSKDKFQNQKNKHFSECAEFSKYYFDTKVSKRRTK